MANTIKGVEIDPVKEKLIELIREIDRKVIVSADMTWDEKKESIYSQMANYLIADGVTFAEDNNVPSKWIPVTERLPEENKKVLGTKRGASAAFVFYGKWRNGNWYDLEWSCYRYGVTHWMPLPEPPEGD